MGCRAAGYIANFYSAAAGCIATLFGYPPPTYEQFGGSIGHIGANQ